MDPTLECDRASHRQVNGAAVSDGDVRRRTASVPHSRPRQRVFGAVRSNDRAMGLTILKDAHAIATGKHSASA
jgi:hypothetical protein